jgi:hypothetical protein
VRTNCHRATPERTDKYVFRPVCVFIYLFCLSISLSIYIYQPIYLLLYLSVCQSLCLPFLSASIRVSVIGLSNLSIYLTSPFSESHYPPNLSVRLCNPSM